MDKNNWRLTNQEKYLKNIKLIFLEYKKYSNEWDHEHCSFCWDKFSEYEGTLHKGYCTLDRYHWICEKCFDDFKEIFNWKIVRNNTIVRFLGISVSAVTSYINRYLNDGIESLLHDKTRKPGKEKISQEIRDETYRLVCTEKPAGETHWSCRNLARKAGIGHTSVNVILRELGLQPHRVSKRTYSNDPEFDKKLTDVVGTIHEPA